MVNSARILAALLTISTILMSCSDPSSPIGDSLPTGTFQRVESLSGGELRSTMTIQSDSAFIYDTLLSTVGGTVTIDSTHLTTIALDPAGDGYLRGVEEHRSNNADNSEDILRYWYFFTRGDSLFYYRGMRLRGNTTSLEGTWYTSSADSAFLGFSNSYTFNDDSVTIVRSSASGVTSTTHHYTAQNNRISIEGYQGLSFGDRYELIPALALYLTNQATIGYDRVEED